MNNSVYILEDRAILYINTIFKYKNGSLKVLIPRWLNLKH